MPSVVDWGTDTPFTAVPGFWAVLVSVVTDFLLFYVGQYQWPTFNVADSAIVVGSGLLVLDLLRTKRQAANVP